LYDQQLDPGRRWLMQAKDDYDKQARHQRIRDANAAAARARRQ